jgi:cytochrome d ubiquinol oxidase subunit II
MTLDLPLLWAGILAVAVLMYVMLDGFDLGIGILFPFATPQERDVMMDTVAPVWDGNETWLVLGGGGLFAAFPKAFAALMPALYIPVLLMLMGLIFRGVAFEFRLNGRKRGKRFWTAAFIGGSTVATLAQGLVLGGFIQGIALRNGQFSGGAFDWLTGYTLLIAAGLVVGYALLGATWTVWRTEGELHDRARRWAWVASLAVGAMLASVSLATVLIHPQVAARWGVHDGKVDIGRLLPLLPIPLLGAVGLGLVAVSLRRGSHLAPFFGTLLVFFSGYLGLAWDFFPFVAPYHMTFREAANPDNTLGLLLGGAAILLPAIIAYSLWVYWIFRGKVGSDAALYH